MPCKYAIGQRVEIIHEKGVVYEITKTTNRPPCHYDLKRIKDGATLNNVPEVQLSPAN